MKYQVGDTLLFNWNGSLFTKLIEKYNFINYGKSICTHAGKIIADNNDGTFIVAEPVNLKDGFYAYHYDSWWLDSKLDEGILHVARPKNKLNFIYETFLKYEGLPYGILDIFSIGLFWLFGTKLDLTKANALICSESCVRMDYDCSDGKINLEKEFNKPYSLITPMDIFLSKHYTIFGKHKSSEINQKI